MNVKLTCVFVEKGIHGLPHKPWNGVEQVDGAPDVGYCPHGVSVVLYEMRLFMTEISQILTVTKMRRKLSLLHGIDLMLLCSRYGTPMAIYTSPLSLVTIPT